eukprot:gene4829-5077_t
MSAIESGKQRQLLQQAQALSAELRSLPLDPSSLADATAALADGATKSMWEQRGSWLQEEISSLALERVQSGTPDQFGGNLLALLMAAAQVAEHAEQEQAQAAGAMHAAEAKEAMRDLALTREERDKVAQQLEVLQAAQAATAGEAGKQAKSQAAVVERLIELNAELMDSANRVTNVHQQEETAQQQHQHHQHQDAMMQLPAPVMEAMPQHVCKPGLSMLPPPAAAAVQSVLLPQTSGGISAALPPGHAGVGTSTPMTAHGTLGSLAGRLWGSSGAGAPTAKPWVPPSPLHGTGAATGGCGGDAAGTGAGTVLPMAPAGSSAAEPSGGVPGADAAGDSSDAGLEDAFAAFLTKN